MSSSQQPPANPPKIYYYYKKGNYHGRHKLDQIKKYARSYQRSEKKEYVYDQYTRIALKSVKWQDLKKRDEVNEFILGYAKIQGTFLVDPLATITSSLTNTEVDYVRDYILGNPIINYYLYFYEGPAGSFGKNVLHAVYEDLYNIKDEIGRRRALYAVPGTPNLDNIISYRVLPLPVRTTIIPFMGCLIYDGILGEYPIDFGPGLNETIERDYDKLEKIYYL